MRFSRCFLSISNCEETDDITQTCVKCAPGFNRTLDGFCALFDSNCVEVVKGICRTCRVNYHLNDAFFCILNPRGCRIYDFSIRKCRVCYDQYLLVNGICSLKDGIYNGCKKFTEGFPECLEC